MAIRRLIDKKTMASNRGISAAREYLNSAIDKIATACGLSAKEKKALKLRLTKKEV